MIDLEEESLDFIRSVVRKYAPGCAVMVFGSRVHETATKYSDIDIALRAETLIDRSILAQIREAFSLSNLPISVDVVDYSAVSPEFRAIITCRYEELEL